MIYFLATLAALAVALIALFIRFFLAMKEEQDESLRGFIAYRDEQKKDDKDKL